MVRRRRGAGLVEAALIMLALVVTLLGALDLGQMLFFHQAFRERVRQAVRWSVVNEYNPEVIQNFVLYNSRSEGARALLGLSRSAVVVTRLDEGTAADRIEVRIENVPLRFYTPFLYGASIQPVFRAIEPVESLGATD